MEILLDKLIFTFGLVFRILFYSTFILLIFFDNVRKIRIQHKKQINILIIFFAICYLGFVIPLFFSGSNLHIISRIFFSWSLFFSYIFLVNNLKKIILDNFKSKTLAVILILIVLFCNSMLNSEATSGWGIGPGIQSHFFLSIFLPILTCLLININSKGDYFVPFGPFIIIATIIQFCFGIYLSYGRYGYFSDTLELSIIFISNTFIFLTVGIYNSILLFRRDKSIVDNT